ncbi:MAG: ribose 5-phosphate isomerase B [Anaeroplasmataceae bacterium]
MKVSLACDHGGLNLKNKIIESLKIEGYEVIDFGTYTFDTCDYPEFAKKVCNSVLSNETERGILVCSTGIGMSIVANKFVGIRCALVSDINSAVLTREHNNTNVLALGEKNVSLELGVDIAKTWLKTEFSNEERHVRRINSIEK